MKKIVKFGGSSLADATQFKKVVKIIKSDESRRYVVPSAPGKRFKEDIKVTDLLYQTYNAKDKKTFEDNFNLVKARFQSIIDELKLDLSLEQEFATIKKAFQNKIGIDYAASRGEYLNGIVLANYLGFEFIDASEVIFIDEHGNYDEAKTDPILSKRLSEVKNAVIPGFYGSLNDGSNTIKTFSRGGSDVTGSIIARNGHVDL